MGNSYGSLPGARRDDAHTLLHYNTWDTLPAINSTESDFPRQTLLRFAVPLT